MKVGTTGRTLNALMQHATCNISTLSISQKCCHDIKELDLNITKWLFVFNYRMPGFGPKFFNRHFVRCWCRASAKQMSIPNELAPIAKNNRQYMYQEPLYYICMKVHDNTKLILYKKRDFFLLWYIIINNF